MQKDRSLGRSTVLVVTSGSAQPRGHCHLIVDMMCGNSLWKPKANDALPSVIGLIHRQGHSVGIVKGNA